MNDIKRELKRLYSLKMIGFKYIDSSEIDVGSSLSDDHLPNSLEQLEKIAKSCHLCHLAKNRKNVVFGAGNINADLMIIGEAPGATEDELGKTFVGKSGNLLSSMIENGIGVKKESVYVTNILKCRPPENRAPKDDEVEACKGFILKQIELVKPKIIFLLGKTSFHYLIGDDSPISKVRGVKFSKFGATIVPSFHPSYLLRNPSAKKESYQDCLLVKQLLNS